MDALADPTLRVEDCVLATDVTGLYVLPAGNQTNSDSEFLSSKRTAAVLDRLTQGAPNRLVIFDSPPALAASPAAELAKYVGQALVVARADTTGQSALEDALSLLSNCPDIKLILNGAPVLILFCGDSAGGSFASINANLALHNAALAAETLGLGCFYGGFVVIASEREARIARLAGLPETHKIYGALALGWPRLTYKAWPQREPARVTWVGAD